MPVPVFLPTTLDSTEKILAAIEELKGNVPSDPLEAELLNLSGVVPEHVGKAETSDVASEFPDELLTVWSAGGCVWQEGFGVVFFFKQSLSTTVMSLRSYIKLHHTLMSDGN